MGGEYPYDAEQHVEALIRSLQTLIARDPEHEVKGLAIPVLGATLEAIKQAKSDDPVVGAVVEIMSADLISSGQPIPAAGMLVVAEQLNAAIGPLPSVIA